MKNIIFIPILFLCFGRAYAQPYVTLSSNPDQTIYTNVGTPTLTGLTTLNCDMLDLGTTLPMGGNPIGVNKLWAVVWDNATSNSSINRYGIQVGGTGLTELTIPIAGGTVPIYPDVVLGNYLDGNMVVHYYVTVVYGLSGSIYLESYELNVSGGAISIISSVTPSSALNSGTNYAYAPHIDLSADPAGYTSGTYVPYMHNFVVVWTEHSVISSKDEIWGTKDDLATITNGSTFTQTQISSDGMLADVGVTLDPVNNQNIAYVVYKDYTTQQNLLVSEWDLNGVVSAPTTVATLMGNTFNTPRIDAVTLYDYNSPSKPIIWRAVDYIYQPPFSTYGHTYDIFHVSGYKTGGIYNTSSYLDAFNSFGWLGALCSPACLYPPWSPYTYENTLPVVSGTGDFLGGGIAPGKDQFSVAHSSTVGAYLTCPVPFSCELSPSSAWLSFSNGGVADAGTFYTYGIDNSYLTKTGMGVDPGSVLQQVNYSLLNDRFATGYRDAAVAVANCTNSGYDVMVAWYDNDDVGNTGVGNIRYKFGGTTSSFKTASILNINNIQNQYNIYPNPAKKLLNVEGSVKADFEITDAVGKSIKTGTVNGKNKAIDISALASGAYLIRISENGNSKQIKFVKE